MHPASVMLVFTAFIVVPTQYDGFGCAPSRIWCAILPHEQPDEMPWQNREAPRMTSAPVMASGAAAVMQGDPMRDIARSYNGQN